MTAEAYDQLLAEIEELKDLIAEQKKQIIEFSKDYLELLEEINGDLCHLEGRNSKNTGDRISGLIEKYNKKLWSQKK